MSDGIYAATSGALAQLEQLDSVSNNLANVNTPGFKRQGLVFSQVLASKDLAFTQVDGAVTQMTQGGFDKTDRPLDVALSGPGFLAVETTRGERYTRAGHLNLNSEGLLVSQDGAPVLDVDQQRITLDPRRQYAIGREGDITCEGQRVATLRLVEIKDPKPEGATLFTTNEEPVASKSTTLQTGMLETANVSAVEQMTRLIELNRLYDATMSAIRTYSEIDSKTANEMTR